MTTYTFKITTMDNRSFSTTVESSRKPRRETFNPNLFVWPAKPAAVAKRAAAKHFGRKCLPNGCTVQLVSAVTA